MRGHRGRDCRPYFSSTEPSVPFDELQLAAKIAGECGPLGDAPGWDGEQYAIDDYIVRQGLVRAASKVLRRGQP